MTIDAGRILQSALRGSHEVDRFFVLNGSADADDAPAIIGRKGIGFVAARVDAAGVITWHGDAVATESEALQQLRRDPQTPR